MPPPDRAERTSSPSSPSSFAPWLWGVATIALCLAATAVAKPYEEDDGFYYDPFGEEGGHDGGREAIGNSAAAAVPAKTAPGVGTAVKIFLYFSGISDQFCTSNAFCLSTARPAQQTTEPRACDSISRCPNTEDCDNGTCVCRYPFPKDFVCTIHGYKLICELGTCSTRPLPNYDSPMTELMPLALTTGVCFVVAVTAMLACKMLIKRMHAANPATRLGDGDSDSVSSMQRWINERLRDRPPRYEEMGSASSATAAQAAGPATVSAAVAEAEKPPSYEVVVSNTSGVHYQGPVADNIPPPLYSAEAMQDASDGRRCYRNPCFLGDVEEPPPYSQEAASAARSARSISLPDPIVGPSLFDPFEPTAESSDASFTSFTESSATTAESPPSSPTTSMTSFESASSSASAPPPDSCGVDLLTVSQAVALKDMLRAEGVAADAVVERSSTGLWTSTC